MTDETRFSKRDLYNKDLTEEEKEEIQNYILHLSSEDMKQGQSGMLYNGFVYDFNHAPEKKTSY